MSKCSVENCQSPIKHKGLCGKHYKRQWRHGDPTKTMINMDGGLCAAPNCERPEASKGYCKVHYLRISRYGRLHTVKAPFGSGYIDHNGYRIRTIGGKKQYEHILLAEKALGKPLPKGAVVHHVNGIKHDNRPENLVICPNQAYHRLLHDRTDALRHKETKADDT